MSNPLQTLIATITFGKARQPSCTLDAQSARLISKAASQKLEAERIARDEEERRSVMADIQKWAKCGYSAMTCYYPLSMRHQAELIEAGYQLTRNRSGSGETLSFQISW